MHATGFHRHIKHQLASGRRGCVWFITLNYSSHLKSEALGPKNEVRGAKKFLQLCFFEWSLKGVDRSTLTIPTIYYSSRLLQRHQWIFAICIFMDPYKVQEAHKKLGRFTSSAWGRKAAADIFDDKTIFIGLQLYLFTWAAGKKTHWQCLTVSVVHVVEILEAAYGSSRAQYQTH